MEAGASYLYADDLCLASAIADVGLTVSDNPAVATETGVWDGYSLLEDPKCGDATWSWKDAYHYGLSPLRYHRAVRKLAETWQWFAMSTFMSSMSTELRNRNLMTLSNQSAYSTMQDKKVEPFYVADRVDACIRARFGESIHFVNGLAGLFAGQQGRMGPYYRWRQHTAHRTPYQVVRRNAVD